MVGASHSPIFAWAGCGWLRVENTQHRMEEVVRTFFPYTSVHFPYSVNKFAHFLNIKERKKNHFSVVGHCVKKSILKRVCLKFCTVPICPHVYLFRFENCSLNPYLGKMEFWSIIGQKRRKREREMQIARSIEFRKNPQAKLIIWYLICRSIFSL